MRPLIVVAILAATAGAGKDLYVRGGPFGPPEASFPWHVAFSVDGKWVAFVDGAAESLSLWQFDPPKEVFSSKLAAGTHQLRFNKDCDKLATIARDKYVVFALEDAGWKLEHEIPLGFEAVASKHRSPKSRLHQLQRGRLLLRGGRHAVQRRNGREGRAYGHMPSALHEDLARAVDHDGPRPVSGRTQATGRRRSWPACAGSCPKNR